MHGAIFQRVTGEALRGEHARLHGFRRYAVIGEDYPGIVTFSGHTVSGVLYREISPQLFHRLDMFEGEMYQRTSVTVDLPSDKNIDAEVYVIRPQYASRLDHRDWDFEHFLRGGTQRFEASYFGFNTIDE